MWFNGAMTTAPCFNKTHGHQMVGECCVRCGMSRAEVNALFGAVVARVGPKLARASKTKPRPSAVAMARRTMHSEMHALAKDISEYCAEEKLFAQFLGRINQVGLPTAYQAFSELRERVDRGRIRQPGRWWMWKTKQLDDKAKNNAK